MRVSTVLRTGAFIAALVFVGCAQPTTGSTPQPAQVRGTNQVTATIHGIVLDGFGEPIANAEVAYSNGNSTSYGTRALNVALTNTYGEYELTFMNEVYSSGDTTVTLAKPGYTTRRISIGIPSIEEIRNNYNLLKPDKNTTFEVTTTNGSTASVKTVSVDDYDGFHVFQEAPKAHLFQINGELTGTILLQKDKNDPTSTATIPPAGSLVSFELPSSAFSPYVFFAKTDATGKFVFSSTGSTATPDSKPNPLPTFGSSTSGGVFGTSSGGQDMGTPVISIQPNTAGAADDTYGLQFYTVTGNTNTTMANLQILPPFGLDANLNDIGTVYAIADRNVRITAWTPITTLDGQVVEMNQLTAAAPTPLTVTFSKAMDTAKCLASDVVLQGVVDYAAIDPTLSWAGNTVTITPSITFRKGDTVVLTFPNWVAADGSSLTTTNATISYKVKSGIAFTTGSWKDASYNTIDVPATANITVKFNIAPASFVASETGLYNITKTQWVSAAVSLDVPNSQILINPTQTLANLDDYEVRFKVLSADVGDPAAEHAGGNALYAFKVDPATTIQVVDTNLWITGQNKNTQFVPTDNLSLTLNRAVLTTPVPTYVLYNDNGTTPDVLDGSDTEAMPVAVTYDTARTTITVDPTAPLSYGTNYLLHSIVHADLENAIDKTIDLPFKTTSDVGIKLVSSNVYKMGGAKNDKFALADNVTLTFDVPVVATPAPEFMVYQDANSNFTVDAGEARFATVTPDATRTIWTINPTLNLDYGKDYLVYYSVYSSATAIADTNTLPFKTLSASVPTLVSANTFKAGLVADDAFVNTANLTLTFSSAVSVTKAPEFILAEDVGGTIGVYDIGTDVTVLSTVTTVDNITFTINPDTNLKFNTNYVVNYTVYSPLDNLTALTSGSGSNHDLSFKTANAGKLATPVVTKDAVVKKMSDLAKNSWAQGKYENGETNLYVSVDTVVGAELLTWAYRYSTDTLWIAGGTDDLTLRATDANYVYSLTLASPIAIDPTKGLSIRLKVSAPSGKYADSDWIEVAAFTDTQRPTGVTDQSTAAFPAWMTNGYTLTATAGVPPIWEQTLAADVTNDRYIVVGIGLTGAETMTPLTVADVVAQVGGAGIAIYSVMMSPDNKTVYVILQIPASATNPVGQFRISNLKDAAGNVFDNNTAATTDDYVTISIL